MTPIKRLSVVTAAVVAVAMAGSACSRSYDTTSVDAGGDPGSGSIPTTTVISGVPSTTTTTTDAEKGSGSSATDPATTVVRQLMAQLAADPTLVARLSSLDTTDLATALGVDPSILARLQVNGSTVGGLGALLSGASPATLTQLAAGSVDPALLNQIVGVVNGTDPLALLQAAGFGPGVLGSLITASQGVDPATLNSLRAALQQLDPAGLGVYASDPTMLALLSVIFGAALTAEPDAAAQLQLLVAGNGEATDLVAQLLGVGSLLDDDAIRALGGLGSVLDTGTLGSLSDFVTLLSTPEVQALLSGIFG